MNINELREKVKNGDFDDNELIDLVLHLERENQVLLEENQKYKEVIDKAIDVLNKMIYQGYVDKNNTQYFATGDRSEFGVRAIELLEILKEMK